MSFLHVAATRPYKQVFNVNLARVRYACRCPNLRSDLRQVNKLQFRCVSGILQKFPVPRTCALEIYVHYILGFRYEGRQTIVKKQILNVGKSAGIQFLCKQ